MRDFAKLKILEVSTISWQYTGWSLAHLQCCEFFFFFFCVGVLLESMSAIGPEIIVQFGIKHIHFNAKYG